MAQKKSSSTKQKSQLKKLDFLIGRWHSSGTILSGATGTAKNIRGMDTYEWISGGCFILHRVDVFMGTDRTEALEIIGYDIERKCYFMQSFDNQGVAATMYTVLKKPGVLQFGDDKMRTVLNAAKTGNSMSAQWELSEDGKSWKPWLEMHFDK